MVDSGASYLADKYHELMALRHEGLSKYKADVVTTLTGPPRKLAFPGISLRKPWQFVRKLGPMYLMDRRPFDLVIDKVISEREQENINILELGPGTGSLAASLRQRFPRITLSHYGIERDRNVLGPYIRVDKVSDVANVMDIFIASEVAEHMPADVFYNSVLLPLKTTLSRNGVAIISVPNPLAPGGVFRDITHVQHYPWYDMYALLRLVFKRVDVTLTHYLWTYQRLISVVPRILGCHALELDWCDQSIYVAYLD